MLRTKKNEKNLDSYIKSFVVVTRSFISEKNSYYAMQGIEAKHRSNKGNTPILKPSPHIKHTSHIKAEYSY